MPSSKEELLRALPSVGALLEHDEVVDWLSGLPRSVVVGAIQEAIERLRGGILAGRITDELDIQNILEGAEDLIAERMSPSLRPVINATGIVLHTGLGRAPLCEAAIDAVAEGSSGYVNLEYRLDTGTRGRRIDHVATEIARLCDAEAATVVNNNAAATLMILRTFAAGREAVVSRGQLVEIGGSFRLPEIMAASGAVLREVGTTNRTRIADYEKAIGDQTAMLMRVHPSNYKIVGFTRETPIGEIAELAHRFGLLAVDDLGSGSLLDLTPLGLAGEPCVSDSIAAGADLVCFSGDKLLGGPQCGIIVGRRACIDALDRDPLMRTYRLDKMVLLALEATLRHYVDPEEARQRIPTLAMLTMSQAELSKRAQKLCKMLEEAIDDEHFFIGSDVGYAGGGSLPGRELPTVVIQWRPAASSSTRMAAALRSAEHPVIARVFDDAICFDLRTIAEEEFEPLTATVLDAVLDNAPEQTGNPGDISLPLA
jgi:L-seryl-tRNA(Ser) seleniumtransferase